MGLFKKNEDHIHASFANVRKDTQTLYDWVRYLNERVRSQEYVVQQQQSTIFALHEQLQTVPTAQHIQQIVHRQLPFQHLRNIQQRLNSLNQKVSVVAALHDTTHSKVSELQQKIEHLSSPKSSALQEKIVRNIARNSKSYIKSALVSTIGRHNKISALQLKELIVDEQHLCSKSSFYRLLQELENDEKCEVIKDGKQKVYLVKQMNLQ